MEPGFELLGHIADPGGVFVLRLKGRIVYVGRSKNLYSRAGNAAIRMKTPLRRARHWTEGDFNGIPLLFDEVWVKFCGETEAIRLAADLIEKYRPEQQPPVRLNGLARRPGRRIDLWALAKSAGVKLERIKEDNRRVR